MNISLLELVLLSTQLWYLQYLLLYLVALKLQYPLISVAVKSRTPNPYKVNKKVLFLANFIGDALFNETKITTCFLYKKQPCKKNKALLRNTVRLIFKSKFEKNIFQETFLWNWKQNTNKTQNFFKQIPNAKYKYLFHTSQLPHLGCCYCCYCRKRWKVYTFLRSDLDINSLNKANKVRVHTRFFSWKKRRSWRL